MLQASPQGSTCWYVNSQHHPVCTPSTGLQQPQRRCAATVDMAHAGSCMPADPASSHARGTQHSIGCRLNTIIQAPGCVAAPATAWPRAGMQPNSAMLSPCLTEQLGLLGTAQATVLVHAANTPAPGEAITFTPVACGSAPTQASSDDTHRLPLLTIGPPRVQSDRTAAIMRLAGYDSVGWLCFPPTHNAPQW